MQLVPAKLYDIYLKEFVRNFVSLAQSCKNIVVERVNSLLKT